MTGFLPPVGDDDLHAFVDGETAPGRRAAVLSHLAGSPSDAARVETWRRQNETILAAFAGVEAEQVPLSWSLAPRAKRGGFPCRLLTRPERTAGIGRTESAPRASFWRRHGRNWSLVLSGFAGGLVGAIATSILVERFDASNPAPVAAADKAPPPAETDAAFVDRATSTLQTFAPQPLATKTALPQGARIETHSVAGLVLPNLSGAGLKFSGVRVAPGAFGQIACLFYAKAAIANIALCVEAAEDAGPSGFQKAGRFPAGAILWRQRGARYALAGPLTEIELRNLAERAHAEVDAFDLR